MRINKRVRSKFVERIAPDRRIEAVIALQRALNAPGPLGGSGLEVSYLERENLVESLAPERPVDQQWCVVTESRVLFFLKKAGGLRFLATGGELMHELSRDEVSVAWGDYEGGAPKLRVRLLAITCDDGRTTVQNTVLAAASREFNQSDEADMFVAAFGERASEIELPSR